MLPKMEGLNQLQRESVYDGYSDAALTLTSSGEQLSEEVYRDLANIALIIDAPVKVQRQIQSHTRANQATHASENGLRIKGRILAMLTQYADPELMGYGSDDSEDLE